MATFEELGSDIYLHLLWYVSLLDAFWLSTLNKALYSLSNERIYWNTVLKHAVKLNGAIPYPSHGDVSRLRLHDLKRLAYCSAKLGATWPSGEPRRLTLRQSFSTSSGARPSGNSDYCIVCIVPGTSLVITSSFADGEVACWDRSRKIKLCFLRLGKATPIAPAVNDPGSTLIGVETLQRIPGPDDPVHRDLVVFRISHDREAPVTMDIIWRRGFRLTGSVRCFAINTELVAYSEESLTSEFLSIQIESLFTGKSVAAQAHIPPHEAFHQFGWYATLGFFGKDLCLFGLYHWRPSRFFYMRRWDAQSLPYDTNDAMGDPKSGTMAKVILTGYPWPEDFQFPRSGVLTSVFKSTERGIIVSICTGPHERSPPAYPPKTGFHIWKPSHVPSSAKTDGQVCEFVPQEMFLDYASYSQATTPWCSSFLGYTVDPDDPLSPQLLCLIRYYSAGDLSDNAPSISMHRLLVPMSAVDFDSFFDIIHMAVDESYGLILLMKNDGTLFIFSYI